MSEDNIRESWEVSGVKDNVTKVANGVYENKDINELVCEFKDEFLGRKDFESFSTEFPLLIKFYKCSGKAFHTGTSYLFSSVRSHLIYCLQLP